MLPNNKQIVIKIFVIATLRLLFVFSLKAQQFNNWYFYSNNGITFNSSNPSFLSGSLITNYPKTGPGSSIISSINGQIKFYTNGVTVWNNNNDTLINGTGLLGDESLLNSSLIIPYINDTEKFFVFTTQGSFASVNKLIDTMFYRYSIIDFSKTKKGEILQKNIPIRNFSTEKMVAVRSENGADIWLILRNWRNSFFSYKINCLGLDTVKITESNVGKDINNNNDLIFGDIKSSSNSKLIASCQRDYFEIFQFDNLNGNLKNPICIPTNNCYGIEFSPNSRFLYVSMLGFPRDGTTTTTYQFDLSIYDSAAIYNSAVQLQPTGSTVNGMIGGLQLGPDGKIYHCGLTNFIDRIEFPNLKGMASSVTENFLVMPNSNFRRFPYAPPFLFASPNVQIPTYTLASNCRSVTLTGKTYIKGNNLSFKWYFGDGDSTMQVVPSGGDTTYTTVTHTYPLGKDTFSVQLFVTSDTVCGQGSAGKMVIVKPPPPTAKFVVSNLCNNLTAIFSDSSLLNFNPSLTYEWQFLTKNNLLLGNSNLQNPSFTFPSYDSFYVRLIARSFLSCVEADTITKLIVLKAKPTASFSYTNTCGSLLASFTNNSVVVADTLSSYYWSFGGSNTSTQKNPSFSFAAFGSYMVKLVVTSSQGCVSDTFSFPVSIKDKPIANFLYGNNGCSGTPVLLQDNSTILATTINQFYWQLPSGVSFSTSTINPTFTVGNNYNLKYVVTSVQGCISDTLQKSISIESVPVAAIATPINTCANQPFGLNDSSTIAFGQINNWAWQIGTQSSTMQNPSFTISSPANLTVNLVVTSKNGCVSNTATKPISIETTPVSSFTNGIACVNNPATFTNTSSNVFGSITSTNWSINNSIVSTNATGFTNTFTQKGNYQIQLQSTTINGCTSTETKTIVVDHAIANAGKDFSAIENQPFMLQGGGGVQYYWHPPTGLSDTTIATPTGVLQNNQLYSLKITTAQGCIGYDTVLVTVLRNLVIPNAFSPNNDGINDFWTIEQLKDYPNAQIQLFNRSGQLVHSTKNNIKIWNGFINNQPAPIGAYYYVINLNNNLLNKPFSGVVMVVR